MIRAAVITAAIAAIGMLLPAVIIAYGATPQSALVVFLHTPDPAILSPGTAILGWQGRIARFEGIDGAAARHLYTAGALLVMPIRKSGCISLRQT